LEKGPNLLELIPKVSLKFREKGIGVISDIKRMFLQISVTQQDRGFLRFLWWLKDDKGKIGVFRHRSGFWSELLPLPVRSGYQSSFETI
jgi:hypothetical protein